MYNTNIKYSTFRCYFPKRRRRGSAKSPKCSALLCPENSRKFDLDVCMVRPYPWTSNLSIICYLGVQLSHTGVCSRSAAHAHANTSNRDQELVTFGFKIHSSNVGFLIFLKCVKFGKFVCSLLLLLLYTLLRSTHVLSHVTPNFQVLMSLKR